MEYIIIWIVVCFLVAFSGSNKRIGFFGVFIFSLILSPIIGLIIGLVSARKEIKKIPTVDKSRFIRIQARKLKDKKEFESAIRLLQQELSINAKNYGVMMDMACCYSLQNRNIDALNILGKAIELGYSNFEFINTDEDLANLRSTPEFKNFKNNSYRFVSNNIQTESNLDKIKKLKELKDEGAITEEEINTEKKKLLV